MAFLGIFLISAAMLALQVLQTRIFSFTLWHHLAYMVVTIALMGMSAAGTWLSIRKKETRTPWKFLGLSSFLFSIGVVVSFAAVTRIPLDTYMADTVLQMAYIFLYYLVLVFPYFFAGVVIAFIFRHMKETVNVYYLFNLLGSAAGGFAVLPVLEATDGEAAILLVASAGVAASLCFFIKHRHRKTIIVPVMGILIFFGLYFLRFEVFPVTSPPSKALGMARELDPNQEIIYKNWNRVARIDVVDNERSQEMFNYFPEIENMIITIDGDAYTLLYDFPGAIKNYAETHPDFTPRENNYYSAYPPIGKSLYSAAYIIKDKPKVLIAGIGGGLDIITARYHEAEEVTAVEINEAMIDASVSYGDYTGNPYEPEHVEVIHSEARSFIRRTDETYDLIQMSGVDTWTALASGAYVMSESYIYTTDAMREYIDHLEDDGTLSIMRWLFLPPREMLRLSVQAVKVLRENGAPAPENHIIVVGDGNLATILVKKRPFSEKEVSKIADWAVSDNDKRVIYAPGFKAPSPGYYRPVFSQYMHNIPLNQGLKFFRESFDEFFEAVAVGTEEEFIKDYYFNITPVNDDKPFFFRYYKWAHVFSGDWGVSGCPVDLKPTGLIILTLSFLQALIFSFLLVLLPLIVFRKKGKTFSPGLQITYFFMIGMGFMFIEISTIQQFVLFLGNPADAIAITIMILLLFTGIGSLFSKKILILLGEKNLYRLLMIFVPLLIMSYAVLIPGITHYFLHSSFSFRVFVSFILLFPLGFCLGLFYPTGLMLVGDKNSDFIPWAFAVNGVASVISSILSILLAMVYGFTFVLVVAAFLYFFACVAFYRFSIKHK